MSFNFDSALQAYEDVANVNINLAINVFDTKDLRNLAIESIAGLRKCLNANTRLQEAKLQNNKKIKSLERNILANNDDIKTSARLNFEASKNKEITDLKDKDEELTMKLDIIKNEINYYNMMNKTANSMLYGLH